MTARQEGEEETTRVCVKNVPPNFTEAKLRSHLCSSSSQSLIITDCKILRTEQGKSRKLAFIGFKDAEVSLTIHYFLLSCNILRYKVTSCLKNLTGWNFSVIFDRWQNMRFRISTNPLQRHLG